MRRFRTPIVPLAVLTAAAVALPALAASLTVEISNQGLPLPDHKQGRFYVYEVGKREQYLEWGFSGATVRVPDGEYDVLLRYVNGKIESEQVWEKVRLEGSVERGYEFAIEPARLTVGVTTGGAPVPPFAGKVDLYRSGQRGSPATAFRPGETVTVRAGTYDIEAVYRGSDGMKRQWLENVSVYGERTVTVEVGATATRVAFTLSRGGRPLPPEAATWRIYRPGERDRPVAEAPNGEARSVPPGRYDVGLFYRDGDRRGEQWLRNEALSGTVRRDVDLGATGEGVTVLIRARNRAVRDAWFEIHPPGDRGRPLARGLSGERVEVGTGPYDVGLFLRRDGIRIERWIESRELTPGETLELELDARPASLRVEAPRRAPDARAASQVLVLLDSSAEMGVGLEGQKRLDRARDLLKEALGLLQGTGIEVGLRAFGIAPASQEDCRDSSLLVRPGRLDRRALDGSLKLLRPSGLSPIAFSLEQAARDFSGDGERVLLLVTGSRESCGGDACAAAARLVAGGTVDRIHVVGVGLDDPERPGLDCIGNFHPARSELELRTTLRDVVRDLRRDVTGTVSIFRPGFAELLVSGSIGERLEVAEGTYDVLVRLGDERFRWEGVTIRGDLRAPARERPPR